MERRAFALIFSLIVVVMLVVLSVAMLAQSISEGRMAQRELESAQAFWATEAGVNKTLDDLRNNYELSGEQTLASLGSGKGEYQATITQDLPNPGDRTVVVYGYFPAKDSYLSKREIKVVLNRSIPPGFYDNAVYSAGNVTINGNAFNVSANDADGDGSPDESEPAIVYAGEADISNPENITGTVSSDSSISPLARLDFQELYDKSFAQGNVYDEDRIDSGDAFPNSYWYSIDDVNSNGQVDVGENWVPNVVYVETDLTLQGGIGTIAGFFVVAGDVITNPSGTYDATINGNGKIEGVIYTRGSFRVNGGGSGLNIDGGVWAGEGVRFNGGVNTAYNEDYMNAIQDLDIAGTAQVISWEDLQNPYNLE